MMIIPSSIKSLNVASIMDWNVAGELHKKHYCGFEKSSIGFEGSFPVISVLDPNIIISPSYVKFSEIFGSLNFVHQFRNQRKGISVFDCPFVQIAVVLTGS